MSQEFSTTESCIFEALSILDEFLLNPQIRTISGTSLGGLWNADVENQEPSRDCSQNDHYPEVEFCTCRASSLTESNQEKTSHMVKGVGEEITYCAPETSLGKQKKARSTSQPPFRSENTPATIEADQILLTLQKLVSNSNSANFSRN